MGGMHNFIGKYSYVGMPSLSIPFIPYTSLYPLISKTPQTPLHPISVAPSLVSTHIYLGNLTFVLDLMKWLQYGGSESLSLINVNNRFFQQTGDSILYKLKDFVILK